MLVFLMALWGCAQEEEDTVIWAEATMTFLPEAPWDPIRASAHREECADAEEFGGADCEPSWENAEPIVENDEGEIVALEPYVYNGDVYAYLPTEEWVPGDYRVVGVVEVPEASLDVPFTVRPWGSAPGFEPSSLAGRVFDVYKTGLIVTNPTGDLFWAYVGQPQLEFLSVAEDGTAEFRLVTTTKELGTPCVVLHDTGTVDDSGRFRWKKEHLTVDLGVDSEMLEAWDVSIMAGFGGDFPNEGSATVGGIVDTARVSVLVSEDTDQAGTESAICELAGSLGAYCTTCPDEAGEYCFGGDMYSSPLKDWGADLPDDLPLCGVDLENAEIPSLSCDIDWDDFDGSCGTCSGMGVQGGLPGLLAGLSALWTRRRGFTPSPK